MPKKTSKIHQLLDNAIYLGKVTTNRTVYYIFQTEKDYLLFTFKDATFMSGNFNVVMADTVEMVYSSFKGKKRVTSGEVQEHPRMRKFVTRFEALQALYVLVAKRQASIDKRSQKKKDSLLQYQVTSGN
jgi:hypothetical protein